ncbi:MAG: hypothetical protein RL189_1883 [Pseudomonadota bacterium]
MKQRCEKMLRVLKLLPLAIVFSSTDGAWAETLQSERLDSVNWTDARGWVQHLNALRQSPNDWQSALNGSDDASMPNSFSHCLSKASEDEKITARCTVLALEAAQNYSQKNAPADEQLIHKVDIFSALLKKSQNSASWPAWLRLASVQALAGNLIAAKDAIGHARMAAERSGTTEKWVSERLDVFEHILVELMNSKAGLHSHLTDSARVKPEDTQAKFILARARKVVQAGKAISSKEKADRTSLDELLSELTRSRWVLSHDRSEIASLREQVLKSQLNLQSFGRIDSIVNQHNFKTPEWQAIVALLSGVSAKVEFVARNDGLFLPFELWLTAQANPQQGLFLDEDRFLSSKNHILDEYIRRLGRLISELPSKTSIAEEQEQYRALAVRTEGMNSSVGVVLNGVPASEKQQRVLLIKEELRTSDARLRELHSRLAAIDFLTTTDANNSVLVRDFARELDVLKSERRALVADYLSTSGNLMPITVAQFESFRERLNQVRKTLADFKELLRGADKLNIEGSQSGIFFAESEKFLSLLLADSERHLAQKSSSVRKVSAGFRQIVADIAQLRTELNKFVSSGAESLRPKLLKILGEVDLELFKRQREHELQEEVVRSKIRGLVSDDLKNAKWRRDRLNDTRRIRSENLEWRAGQ